MAHIHPVAETRSKVPPGKRVLNTHISQEEHAFLKEMATRNAMTVTMVLRNLIRLEMQRITRMDFDPGPPAQRGG